jgi:MFS family permease
LTSPTKPEPENASARELTTGDADLPSLFADPAFHGLNVAQFLGAFNDNLFKQLILLLAVSGGSAAAASSSSTVSGSGLLILFGVLFLMGAQSTFFGPGKYGILPEMLRGIDLPRANGTLLMMTFIAIIFGVAAAGQLATAFGHRLWAACLVCVGIAIVGTAAALFIRKVPAANPQLKLTPDCFFIPREIRKLLVECPGLLVAMLVGSMFWFVGGMVQPSVNALGKIQLGQNEFWTSLLNAAVGLGIAIGCVTAGMLSKGRVNFKVMRVGAIGIVVCLVLLSLPSSLSAWSETAASVSGAVPIQDRQGLAMFCFAVPFLLFSGIAGFISERRSKRTIVIAAKVAEILIMLLGVVVFASYVIPAGESSRVKDQSTEVADVNVGQAPACLPEIAVRLTSFQDTAREAGRQEPALHRTAPQKQVSASQSFPPATHLLGYWGSMVVLLAVGIFTGFFALPIQVFVQSQPPPGAKGRTIAAQNFINWLFIVGSALSYMVVSRTVDALALPRCTQFIIPAVVMLPIAIFYHPKNREL